ncbi:MAG: hypothetical protein HY898_08660 [Deltaproteobacteria bacterium]|nr:hypothetical protein [Deltaproteobacteria bacterium]
MPPRLWLWVGIILAVWAIIYWKYTQEKLDQARNALLARQRDAAAQLNQRFLPLRDRIERWIVDASGSFPGDLVAPEATEAPFRSKPGIYLRLRLSDAADVKSIRRESQVSLRDAFTSCLFRGDNRDPWAGPECKFNHDCPAGQHCNETNHCTVPAQPFNLRVFYRGARVLSEDWIKDVREASDDMRIRLLEHDLDATIKEDVPLAIDLLVRGQYFMLVLDEPAADPASVPDAGGPMESLQAAPHPARVFVYDIPRDKLILRLRTDAAAQVTGPSADPKTTLAVRRQANSCAIAVAVRRALGDPDAP